jgi:hypothetical protein
MLWEGNFFFNYYSVSIKVVRKLVKKSLKPLLFLSFLRDLVYTYNILVYVVSWIYVQVYD